MRRSLLVCMLALVALPAIQIVHASWVHVPLEKLVADNPVIVVGKIESFKKDSALLGRPKSEYDTAYITIAEVLKNELEKPTIKPGSKIPLSMPRQKRLSIDIRYSLGQEGIWILDYRGKTFWATYPGDLQPLSKKQKILAIIQSAVNDIDTIITGNTEFACDLYARLKNDPKIKEKGRNLFFSPYSISTALAMTYAGARGNTETQMAEVLHFTLAQDRLHPAFTSLERQLNAVGQEGTYQLSVANALWGQKGFRFLPEFLHLTEKNYAAALKQVDFINQTEKARKTINHWVEKKTNNKIKDLIKPDILDSLTRLVLTNAIYFKGYWEIQFEKNATENAPFVISPEKRADVPMMHLTDDFKYWGDENLQILELPYKGNDLSMIVFLPRTVEGFESFEKSLTLKNLNNWLPKLRKQKVRVFLPRFKTTSEFNLNKMLIALGMPDAFDLPLADFSGMTGEKNLFIAHVLHKAFVEVNEEGTEAAAATAVIMGLKAAPAAPPPLFRADHPFIFFIKDNNSGSILFLGRLTNPKAQPD